VREIKDRHGKAKSTITGEHEEICRQKLEEGSRWKLKV